ncbi:hypothetical protein QFZ68_004422 [Streptomyces sp. V1I6]|nr:hypothetical protein [Streptomyces sp. V1I6]
MAAAGASVAPQAMALGNDGGTNSLSGNGAAQSYGNSATLGTMSPQLSLAQGSLNKPCVGLPLKGNIQNLAGVADIGVQDVDPVRPAEPAVRENSTQAKSDEPLSHILSDIPVLSGNGSAIDQSRLRGKDPGGHRPPGSSVSPSGRVRTSRSPTSGSGSACRSHRCAARAVPR